jgi:acyl carrier protein
MNYFEEFKNIIAAKTGDADKITMDSNLKELGLDSLDLVEIVLDGEERLGITFENDELLNFKTVGDVVRSAESKK